MHLTVFKIRNVTRWTNCDEKNIDGISQWTHTGGPHGTDLFRRYHISFGDRVDKHNRSRDTHDIDNLLSNDRVNGSIFFVWFSVAFSIKYYSVPYSIESEHLFVGAIVSQGGFYCANKK